LEKRLLIIEDRRKALAKEWKKLNEDERKLDDYKNEMKKKVLIEHNRESMDKELDKKYEIERLKSEKLNVEKKYKDLKNTINKMYVNEKVYTLTENNNERDEDSIDESTSMLNSKTFKISVREAFYSTPSQQQQQEQPNTDRITDQNDEESSKLDEKIRKAKQKLKQIKQNSDIKIESPCSSETESDGVNPMQNDIDYSLRETIKEINEQKKFLENEFNTEKDTLNTAKELLGKFRETLIKRKIKLEASKLNSTTGDSKDPKRKDDFSLKKELVEIEHLELEIKTARLLLEKKENQLKLLESKLFEIHASDSSNELLSSITDDDDDNGGASENSLINILNLKGDDILNYNEQSISENINVLIRKLKLLQENGYFNSKKLKEVKTILKYLVKLTYKLDKTLGNIQTKNSPSFANHSPSANMPVKSKGTPKFSLNTTMHPLSNSQMSFQIKKFQTLNSTDLLTELHRPIDSVSIYNKLAYENDSRLLNEKLNKYFGDSGYGLNTMPRYFVDSSQGKYRKSASVAAAKTSKVTGDIGGLPEGVRQRLNDHREWLKRFKQDVMHSKQFTKFE
jgi:hypothetical protein